MTIHCQCTHCKVKLNLPTKLAGSKGRCPKCKKVFLIPSGEANVSVQGSTSKPPPEVSDVEDPTAPSMDTERIPVAEAIPTEESDTSVPLATPVSATQSLQDVHRAAPFTSDEVPQATVSISAPTTVRRRRDGWQTFMGFVLGVFALLGCLAILAGLGYWLSTRGPQNGKVLIQIPVEHRKDCALFIDGADQEIQRLGDIEITLMKGSHLIELRRIGFEPLKLQVIVTARQKLPITPQWTPVSQESELDAPSPEVNTPRLDPVKAALGADVEN